MQGPLEVLSRNAVETFLDQLGSCKSSIMMDQMGEDQFLDQCLGQLGVQGVAGYHILSDFYCAGMPKACDCAHAAHLESSAFHPCKSQRSYFECHRAAKLRLRVSSAHSFRCCEGEGQRSPKECQSGGECIRIA